MSETENNIQDEPQAAAGETAENLDALEPGCDGGGEPSLRGDEAAGGPAAELALCAAERDAFRDQLLRSRAEFDNYRKRIAREYEQNRIGAAQGIISELLPVLDNLERALQHADGGQGGLADGVRMIVKQFYDVLSARGLEAIPALGLQFDPNVHEALSYLPSEGHQPGEVMIEYEKGYKLGGQVLRPGRVVVSSGPAEKSETAEQ